MNVNLDESEGESDPEVERSPKTAFKSAFPEEEEDEDDDNSEKDEDEDDEDDEEEASEDDDEIESEPELPSDLSDDDGDDMADLDEFVTKLTSADKSVNVEDEVSSSKKRRVLPVVSAPGLSDGGDLALKSSKLSEGITTDNRNQSRPLLTHLLSTRTQWRLGPSLSFQALLVRAQVWGSSSTTANYRTRTYRARSSI